MKKIIGCAVAVVAVMSMGGTVLAASQKETTRVPEKGTWEYQWAMETGNLPSDETGRAKTSGTTLGPQEETVEIGGMTYRIHIDLQ